MNTESAVPSDVSVSPEDAWRLRERDRSKAARIALEQAAATDPVVQAQAQVVLAYIAYREGHWVTALEQNGPAALVLQAHDNHLWMARALNVRVCISVELGDFVAATAALEEQLKLAVLAGNLEMEGCALNDMGMMELTRQSGLAEPHLRKALEIFTQEGNVDGLAFGKINLAIWSEQQGKLEQAQTLLAEASALAEAHDIRLVATHVLAQQGHLALAQKQFERAEAFLQMALEHGRRNRERVLWEVIPPLVQVYLHFQRPEQAIRLLQGHLALVRESGLRPFEAQAHELLADVYSTLGEDRSALEHYREHMRLYRQAFDHTHGERIRALVVLSRIQIAEREAANERKKNIELQGAYANLECLHQQVLEISFTDELTKARNRRYLMTQGALMVRETSPQGVAVALLDIDHFKRINDTLGHDGGDRVLCEFAQMVNSNLRSCDLFARFGGEEFAVLFPNTSVKAASNILWRLRDNLAKHTWASLPAGQGVTFTAGLSAAEGDLMNALRRADALLYIGKNNGRNGVWCQEPGETKRGADK